MSVITKRRASTTSTAAQANDEYAGLYLNPGIFVGDDKDPKFLRFNRGVFLGDLKTKKIYESMDPDFAAETAMVNERIEAIQERALELEEGEWVVVNIPMVLYRRMEEADVAPTPKADKAAIRSELFG